MTCHFCGQPSTSVHEPGTQCLSCDKWFCKNCVDKDSHECFSALLDTDQAGVTPELRVGVTERGWRPTLTCHKCGQTGHYGPTMRGCSCGHWFCEHCADPDKHGCEETVTLTEGQLDQILDLPVVRKGFWDYAWFAAVAVFALIGVVTFVLWAAQMVRFIS